MKETKKKKIVPIQLKTAEYKIQKKILKTNLKVRDVTKLHFFGQSKKMLEFFIQKGI